MKKLLLILFAFALSGGMAWGQIISQYIETNSGTTPKGIEIWNNTTGTLDFSSNSLVIKKGTNGGAPSDDYTLSSGTLAPGKVIVIGTSDLQTTTENNGSVFYLKAFTFNGDDALEVWYGGTKTDIFGTPGSDPGSSWSGNGVYTANQNIKLKAGITSGASSSWTDPSTRFVTVSTDPVGTNGDEGFGVEPVYTWSGTSSTDWSSTSNWDGGYVPVDVMNVNIPSGLTNYPSVSGDATTPSQCNNLTIESGASLTIPISKALTVNGDFTNSATTSDVVVQSDATKTGSIIVKGAVTGTATVQRYIDAYSSSTDGWHLLSSPVGSQAISAFHTAGSGDDFYKWDENLNEWVNRTATGGGLNGSFETDFAVGTGYLVAYQSAGTKDFTGAVNTASVNVSSLSKDNDGWHLLGNPYPSALLWNNTTADWGLGTNFSTTAKIWNESSASYTDIGSGSPIPSTQGFMVQCLVANSSLTIPASDRSHNSQSLYKKGSTETNTIKLTVYDTENNTAQESIVKINKEATEGFDPLYDSHFLAGYAPQFYSVLEDGTAVSTNTLPNLTDETEIPFTFIKNNSNNFYMTVEGIETLNPTEKVYLKDLKTGYTQLLNNNPRYDFSSQEGDSPNRFVLLYAPVGIKDNIATQQFNIYNSGNQVYVVSGEENSNALIYIYNVSGQLIKTVKTNGNRKTAIDLENNHGLFIVSVTNGHFTQNQKVLIN